MSRELPSRGPYSWGPVSALVVILAVVTMLKSHGLPGFLFLATAGVSLFLVIAALRALARQGRWRFSWRTLTVFVGYVTLFVGVVVYMNREARMPVLGSLLLPGASALLYWSARKDAGEDD